MILCKITHATATKQETTDWVVGPSLNAIADYYTNELDWRIKQIEILADNDDYDFGSDRNLIIVEGNNND
jgi:hypothetical protein